MVYVLNAPVMTNFGTYRFSDIGADEARQLLEAGFVSAVGHEGSARVLSEITGVFIPINRIAVHMKPGDKALVLWLIERLDEGEILCASELVTHPLELGLLERIS